MKTTYELHLKGLDLTIDTSLFKVIRIENDFGRPVLILQNLMNNTELRLLVDVELTTEYNKRMSAFKRSIEKRPSEDVPYTADSVWKAFSK